MLRLFALSCVLADITGTLASLGTDWNRLGWAGWLVLNVALIALPLAVRGVEPLLASLSNIRDDEFARAELFSAATLPADVLTSPLRKASSSAN